MRVLQLHAGYRTPAGEDVVVAIEATSLRNAGHQVLQHIEQNPPERLRAIQSLGRSLNNRRTAERVEGLIDTFQPDIVHVHNTWFALSPSVIESAARAGVPVVMSVHNYRLGCLNALMYRGEGVCTTCVGRAPIRGVVHGCYRDSRALSAVSAIEIVTTRRRGSLDRVDAFVAPSRFMADRLLDIGLPPERLTVKPHFTPDSGPRYRTPSASDEVLFIGRLASGKGLRTLLRAWERHADSSALGMRLTIIGDGPMAPELRESAPRGVEFAGWLPHAEVRERMKYARAFVFPSEWYEPFGMVLIEAMSAGLPVIATTSSEAGGIADAPPELVAPAGDERALARCLDALTDRVVDAVGADARRRYEAQYSEPIGVANLEALYASVLDSKVRS